MAASKKVSPVFAFTVVGVPSLSMNVTDILMKGMETNNLMKERVICHFFYHFFSKLAGDKDKLRNGTRQNEERKGTGFACSTAVKKERWNPRISRSIFSDNTNKHLNQQAESTQIWPHKSCLRETI